MRLDRSHIEPPLAERRRAAVKASTLIRTRILAALEDGPMTGRQLGQALERGTPTVNYQCRRLQTQGRLERTKERPPRWYLTSRPPEDLDRAADPPPPAEPQAQPSCSDEPDAGSAAPSTPLAPEVSDALTPAEGAGDVPDLDPVPTGAAPSHPEEPPAGAPGGRAVAPVSVPGAPAPPDVGVLLWAYPRGAPPLPAELRELLAAHIRRVAEAEEEEEEEEEDDGPSCRICGCTADQACPGGCWWIATSDPQGDLCSECFAADLARRLEIPARELEDLTEDLLQRRDLVVPCHVEPLFRELRDMATRLLLRSAELLDAHRDNEWGP